MLSTLGRGLMILRPQWNKRQPQRVTWDFRRCSAYPCLTDISGSCGLQICMYCITGWLEEFSRSLSHQNYTFCTQKILLVSLRHPKSLGFQLCMPIFHIHLCTVGQFVLTGPKIWNCPQGQTKANKIFIFINFNLGEP